MQYVLLPAGSFCIPGSAAAQLRQRSAERKSEVYAEAAEHQLIT
jgi:hypothetical protein